MSLVHDMLEELNHLDEHPTLEAKRAEHDLGDSFFETVCAFSNEPDLGGGRIVLGISQSEEDLFGGYEATGVSDPDRISQAIATGCASIFNQPVRPSIHSEEYDGKVVLIVEIAELAPAQKPLYFTRHGLPRGAYRRIGSADIRCTDDDLALFFGNRGNDSFDITLVKTATCGDFDLEAIEHYRKLCAKANPSAEALQWSDDELLQAINAVRRDGDEWKPTLLGLLLFGSRIAFRRELPTVRVDYIRVPGREWVADPEQRFTTTIDMRGPLLQLVERAQAAILDDLPKGFNLEEGAIQAETPSLPARAIREAIVNAVMHRSYREHRPTQIIRYSNRIEISNTGFSLKNEDHLGEPGSELRNPNLATIFFETNTAETKGSGIRVMREQMKAHGFSLPTFESDRANNAFTSRFLLHHFLSKEDLDWLGTIPMPEMTDSIRYALIFVREQGAVDNRTLRQLTGQDVLTSSTELRKLKEAKLLSKKGGGATTYYVPGAKFHPKEESTPDDSSEQVPLDEKHVPLDHEVVSLDEKLVPLTELPQEIRQKLIALGKRPGVQVREVILDLCSWKDCSAKSIAQILGRKDHKRLKRDHLSPMIESGLLIYTHPEMENHPQQAYRTKS